MEYKQYPPLWHASLALPSPHLPTPTRYKGLSLGSETVGAQHLSQDAPVTLVPIAVASSLPPIPNLVGTRGRVFVDGLDMTAKRYLLQLLRPSQKETSLSTPNASLSSRFILFKADSTPSLTNPFDLPVPAEKSIIQARRDPSSSPQLPSHIIMFLSSASKTILYFGYRQRESYPSGLFQPLPYCSEESISIAQAIISSSSSSPYHASNNENLSKGRTSKCQVASAFLLLHPTQGPIRASEPKRPADPPSSSSSSSSEEPSSMLTSPKRIKRSSTLPVISNQSNPLSTPTRPKIKKSQSSADLAKIKRYQSMDSETRQKKKEALEAYNIPRIQKYIEHVLTKKCQLSQSDSMYSALRGKMLGGVYTDLYKTIQTHKLTEKEILAFLGKFL
ncbi:hypothetical protein BJ684DRAFT_18847 [Piptocephalis cylindrospora]|uniref:Uncharacterized protein n=1 Tax=Piptocephalis cylindrospora TaxID=1907219 RepID=A0A4P9Y6V1_9FUNG|nr:hypothetical protein BJ684DRAFT_18847 [Piptocephalis cylindrospora]|eukprot:RKP14765.1 hypothetical protein BJ684DRAFT_18847 [Piptocephalis cylindrospora]